MLVRLFFCISDALNAPPGSSHDILAHRREQDALLCNLSVVIFRLVNLARTVPPR